MIFLPFWGAYDRLDNFWFTLAHELAPFALGYVNSVEGQIEPQNEIENKDLTPRFFSIL